MKPVVSITSRAWKQISKIIQKAPKGALGVKFGIRSGGCSGFEYKVEHLYKVNKNDETIQYDECKVVIDEMAVFYLLGTEIDYKATLDGSRFVYKNPNANHNCGCGKSFG